MKNNQTRSLCVTGGFIQILLIVCVFLLVTACGSSGSSSSTGSTGNADNTTNSDSTAQLTSQDAEIPGDDPEAVASFYIKACESNDPVSAKDVMSRPFSNPCDKIPSDALESAQSGEAEISGKTARVHWEWMLPEERSQKYELTLGLEDEGWRIIDIDKIEEIWQKEEILEIDPELQEEFDEELSEEISYLVQEGVEGEMKITTRFVRTDGVVSSEEIINEEIISEATPKIVMTGQKPESEIWAEVTQLVEDYFANYQAGNYADASYACA